jgi:hypothetical protein
MDRDLRLLDVPRHQELLRNLEKANLFFKVTLPLEMEGPLFVKELNNQVMAHFEQAHVTLPPKRNLAGQASLAANDEGSIDIHNLLFRLLEPSHGRTGARLSITSVTQPLSLEVLLRNPFGQRIPNPIHSCRVLLFIGMLQALVMDAV